MKISRGELDVDIPAVERADEVGLLNGAFSRMAEYLTALSTTCEKIADGDLTFQIKPQSPKDALAISFGLMTENLQGLTREMKGSAAELSNLSVNLAGLINEVISVSADMEAVDRKVRELLQDARKRFCASPETQAWIAELEQAMEKIHATGKSYSDRSIEGQKIALAIEELGAKLNTLVAPLKV
jgi:nitrogen fixation/metabolism regulation signal transduction histidine kinase